MVKQLSDPSDLPKNAFSIFLLLVEHLCVDHIDYALEIGLSGTSTIAHHKSNLCCDDCSHFKNLNSVLHNLQKYIVVDFLKDTCNGGAWSAKGQAKPLASEMNKLFTRNIGILELITFTKMY